MHYTRENNPIWLGVERLAFKTHNAKRITNLTMEKEFKITSAKHYEETMIAVFEMQEQEEPLTKAQKQEMELMIKAAEQYEAEEL